MDGRVPASRHDVADLIGVAFTALLEGTRLRLSTRAVIMNETPAEARGINSAGVRFVTFGLGCGPAAMTGALITPLASVDPDRGAGPAKATFDGLTQGKVSFSTNMPGRAKILAGDRVSVVNHAPDLDGLFAIKSARHGLNGSRLATALPCESVNGGEPEEEDDLQE